MDGKGVELRQQQDIKPEDAQEGHGRDALQVHLIPRPQAGPQGDAHEDSGTPGGMAHDHHQCQAEGHQLEEQQEEERKHDGTCLLCGHQGVAWEYACPLAYGAPMPGVSTSSERAWPCCTVRAWWLVVPHC